MDFEAVSWRPARRLRHVTAIRLHNLYDPTPNGAAFYHYELHTWCVQRCTWTLFYRSEQLPTNNDLDWGRPLLDSESEIGLQGLQHRPDVGPLRLRVYVTGGNSTTVPAANTNSPHLPMGPRSPPQDFAAAVFVLPHEQSDCKALYIPRLRREAERDMIRSDCSAVHEQQTPPSPSALPVHPTWQGRPHSSAKAGAAGDVSFPSQCWEQSKLESVGVRPALCHSTGSEGKATPLWGEVSGPGPPSKAPIPLTQQQPLDPFAEGTFGGSGCKRGVGINGPEGNLERGACVRSAANMRRSALQQDYGQLSNHGQQEQGRLYFQMQQETMQLDGNGRQAYSSPLQRQEYERTREQQQRYGAKDQPLLEQDRPQMGCNVSCAGFEGAETPMDASAVLAQPVSAIAAGTCSSGGPGASSDSSSRGKSSDFGAVGEGISINNIVCGVSVSCETVEAMQGVPCKGGGPAALRSAVILSPPCTDAFPEAESLTIEADLACCVQQQPQLVGAIKPPQVCRGFAPENDIFVGVANGIQPVQLNVTMTESSPTASSSSCASDSASVLEGAAGAVAEGSGQGGATTAKPAEGTTINSVFRREGATHKPADNTWDEVRQAGNHPSQVVNHVNDDGDRASDDGSLRPGGGNTRVLLECVFELNALVPLEPRTLRHGWYINLPVLFMEPNRRPFIPSSALPPPSPPPPPPPRQQPSDLAPGPDDGSNGAGPMCRKRFVALPAPVSAASGNRKPAATATAGIGGGRGTGYHRRSSSGLETGQPGERPSDDKRALLRWLMSSSSVVQPLQAAGSLEEELQDDDFLAAAAAEAAEAAGTATTDGQRPSRLHVQPPQAPRPRTPHHHRSFSAEDAAALLDPGPAPGFLPSALAVLFRQEWPRHPAGPPPAPQHGLRPRSPGLDASPAAGSGLKSGLGRASPLSRRVASTPTLAAIGEANAAEASLSEAPDAPSAPSLVEAAGDGGSEARCLADDAVATHGSLLHHSEASGGYLAHACEGKGDDRLSAAASPASSTVSYAATTSGLVAASVGSLGGSQASLTGLAAAATAGGVWRMASSPSLPSTTIDVDPSGGQHNSLPPHVRPLLLGPRPFHSGSQSTAEELPVDFGAQRSSAATAAGITRMPRNRIPVPVPAMAAIVHNHNHYQHQHQKIPLSASASASVPAVQRLCELVEVRASIRKLKQLQERLTGARAGALDIRRQVDAAVERRYRLDEARARAEAARAEWQEWAARATLAEAQLCAMRTSTARYRRELLDRVRALETASVVLKAAEQRRLSAEEQLAGPSGRGQLAALTAAIVQRRNRLVSELGGIFQVGPISEALLEPDPLDLTLESSWAGEWGSLSSYRHLQGDGSVPAEDAKTDQTQGHGGQRDQQTVFQQTDPCQRLSFQPVPVGGALSAAAAPLPPPPSSATRVLRMDSGSGAVVANNGTTRLAVMGLELPPDLIKRSLQGSAIWSPLGLGQRYDADQRTAAGLGYLAAIVDLASSYLGIPLRYPIAPRVSVSYISDPVPPSANVRLGGASATAGPPPTVAQPPGSAISVIPGAEWRLLSIATSSLTSAAAAVAAAATGPSPLSPPPAVGLIPGPRGVGVGGRLAVFSTLLNAQIDPRVAATPAGAVGDDAHPAGLNPAAGLPLFWGDGARDRTRFAYAVYLLSKDVEQLLAAHGIPPVAPNQPLPNLYVLLTAAASGVPRPPGNASTGADGDGDDASGRGGDGAGFGV
ncbi:hypothetical protein Vretimale_15272 [Volvox reticuliferus]|uniref:Uncharacterized protein n=1 Tax=Volvox reticuliferus TaxID=1737510 RepID=A0A8J4FKD3_9CHLO|nr:hypothetical protein Vretifemale_5433 [Volvox reticuliferus]GIM11814.1 hypothetical protein Vretimale_15272 [Volvox reticuliferus]